jgi:3-(3-hydroxy-phenyl)propionate hydroxylase
MCHGLRDAANLAWKLALAADGGADDALLDSYQAEREPHVREIIDTSVAVGRGICERDPARAAARDADLRRGGRARPRDALPPLRAGLVASEPFRHGAAGEPFPQPVVDDGAGPRHLDDVLGPGPALVTTAAAGTAAGTAASRGVRHVQLGAPGDAPWTDRDGTARHFLSDVGASAAVVRPDRYTFGVCDVVDAPALLDEYTESVTGAGGGAAPGRARRAVPEPGATR